MNDSTGRIPIGIWLSRLPAIVGWVALVALLVAGAHVRFTLAPVAISEADSWGWLHPALGWLGGIGFREEFEREWLYGAFITFAVKSTGSFAGLVVLQQILGLVAAILMWATWRVWLSFFPRTLWLDALSLVPVLAVVTLYLFSPMALLLELSIRPEAILAFVAFAQLLSVSCYCRSRWRAPSAGPAAIFGALAIVLAWAMYILKPNWLLAVPLTTLPVFVGVLGSGLSRAGRFLPPALGLGLGVLTLWLPDRTIFQHAPATRLVLPLTLFTIHADIIREHLASRAARADLSADEREFLAEFLPLLDREMANALVGNPTYKRLGFDPDYLMYRATIFPALEGKFDMSRAEIAAFCRRQFLAAVIHRPFDYARKVGSQFAFFAFPDETTFVRKRARLAEAYVGSLPTLRTFLEPGVNDFTRAAYDILIEQTRELGTRAGDISASRSARRIVRNLLPFLPWVTLLFFVASGAALLWPPLHDLRGPGALALLFLCAPAGNALTVALVHALDNSRYRFSYGPLYAFALAAMALFVIVAAVRTCQAIHRKTFRERSLPD